MKIKITKKQNVRIDGVKYVAVAAENAGCVRCAIKVIEDIDECSSIPCVASDRKDTRHVIFVKKEQK